MQKFEPDQLVLIKAGSIWRLRRYSFFDGSYHETQDGCLWVEDGILPYAGNEQLLGTSNPPPPKWEPKTGELVAVRDSEDEEWKARVFRYRNNDNKFVCDNENANHSICPWDFCEPLRAHFTIPEE